MFQSIPQTPLHDRPKVTHKGQIIQQKKMDTSVQITERILQRVFSLLKKNDSWYEKYTSTTEQLCCMSCTGKT